MEFTIVGAIKSLLIEGTISTIKLINSRKWFSDTGVQMSIIKLAMASNKNGGANFRHCWLPNSMQ